MSSKAGPILKSRIYHHYRLFFLPLLVFALILFIVGAGFGGVVYFCMSYIWSMTFETPGITRRVAQRRYRFASLKMFYIIHVFFRRPNYYLSFLPPSIIILVLNILTGGLGFIWSIFGSIAYISVRKVDLILKKKHQVLPSA